MDGGPLLRNLESPGDLRFMGSCWGIRGFRVFSVFFGFCLGMFWVFRGFRVFSVFFGFCLGMLWVFRGFRGV